MRKSTRISSAASMAFALAACASPAASAPSAEDAEALRLALDDEYLAEATYVAVMDRFGEVRPFVNIIEAEQRHSSRVKSEMDRLGLEYRVENPLIGKIEAPDTLLAACEQGIIAERENIALYDRILPAIEDGQLRSTLTDLQWASRERHLPAFERCVSRGGASGQGAMQEPKQGSVQGRGHAGHVKRANR